MIIAGPRAERNRQAGPGPTVNATAIRAGPESGRNRVTAFAGGLPVMCVGGRSGFPRLTPAGRKAEHGVGHVSPESWEGEQIPTPLRAASRPTREEMTMIILHTVPGDEAETKDTETGTPGDSPEAVLSEAGLDQSTICRILSSEPGAREDRW